MIAAFFHDERFSRDAAGRHLGTGALPHRAFARYLPHFDAILVVARLGPGDPGARTVASGEGVEFACVETAGRSRPTLLAALARRVREVLGACDAAIVRLPSAAGALACEEALRTGKPYLAEVVGDPFQSLWWHGSLAGKLAAPAMAALTRRHVARAPFAIYVTREALQRRYPTAGAWTHASNVLVAPPAPEVLSARLARIAARRPADPLTIGLVGSYDVGYKGHGEALRAVALLARAGRAATLRCVGVGDPGRWRARAEALGIGHLVELAPALPQGGAVLRWMDGLDLLAVPSLTEGLPRSLVEAMSRALPAVGSRVGGIPELLEGAALHRARDARDLARAVAAVSQDAGTLAAHARRSFAVAAEYAADVIERRRDALVARFAAAAARARRARAPAAPAPAPR